MSSQTFLDLVVFASLAMLFAIFLLLEAKALRIWRGTWRVAAIAPAMVIGWIVLGVIVNPAAHSLWPIELILWLIPAIIALLIARTLVRGAERPHTI